MIEEVDEALAALVRRDAVPGAGVEVVFDAPTKDWAARRNAPTVSLFLYDLREDLRRRSRGLSNEYGEPESEDGPRPVTARRTPPRWFKLSYMVTAWTARPEDEHRLLSALLRCVLAHEKVPDELLVGSLVDIGLPVPLTVGLPPPEDRSFADVWSALGGELKPSLDIVVSVPIDSRQLVEAGPPVRFGPTIQLSDRDGTASDKAGGPPAPRPNGATGAAAAKGTRVAIKRKRGGRNTS
jgi:hypothetical protein